MSLNAKSQCTPTELTAPLEVDCGGGRSIAMSPPSVSRPAQSPPHIFPDLLFLGYVAFAVDFALAVHFQGVTVKCSDEVDT